MSRNKKPGTGGSGGGVNSVTGNLVNNTDPLNPTVNGVVSVTGDSVDHTIPQSPNLLNALYQTNGAPTVNDDSTNGHFMSQMWYDLNTGILYEAFNVIPGSATWLVVNYPSSKNNVSSIDPTPLNDGS